MSETSSPQAGHPGAVRRERDERIDALVVRVRAQAGSAQADSLERCVRELLRQHDDDDIAAASPDDLLGAVLSLWQHGTRRTPGAPKVRVLNPSVSDSGWASRHTVIEIVNDDMPFLVDSTAMAINSQGLTLHLIAHPVFAVERQADGSLLALRMPQEAPSAARESWMHIEVDRIVDPKRRAALVAALEHTLAEVRAAVTDWPAMRARLEQAAGELQAAQAALPAGATDESVAFLSWLADDHFTLLGYRCHDLIAGADGADGLRLVGGSGLGVLRETEADQLSASFAVLPPKAREMARAPLPLLLVTKANTRATVHRPGYTDYIGVKRYDAQGAVIGEHRFIGLFTSSAYSTRVADTPLLRGKMRSLAARAGFASGGHLEKALHHLVETYPRDELYQLTDDALYDNAMGILALGERKRLRLLTWADPFDRFVSCLVYVPRDAYSTDLRMKLQAILLNAFAGTRAEYDVQLGDATLARIHFTVRTVPGQVPPWDRKAIEARLAAAARRWDDELSDALVEAEGEARGLELLERFGRAFPLAYRERVAARAAVADVRKLAALTPEEPVAVALVRPLGAPPDTLGFRIYRLGGAVALSDSLPMLERLGARVIGENNDHLTLPEGTRVALHDFVLQAQIPDAAEADEVARRFEHTFLLVLRGEVENDDFNRLVLRAGLQAREVVVLRAYAKYLKQIGFALSQATIEATLGRHATIARMLVKLFQLRLHPTEHDDEAAAAQTRGLERALEKVENLSEDRVLRQLQALIECTLRTNFWRTGSGHSGAAGALRPFLSFKLDSARVPGLPAPRPMVEICVYSPRFEGIHLRGGKVARGGLRWSDRPDDFRTEVLALVKAQMVKNTVIVPVGSKGGFVLKKAPPASDREAFMKEGIACYQDYLRGLLDLTDNLVAGKPVAPPQVRRRDGDDPYLVVAADKGTATFSDYANAISAEYGHWLGDAFASGGSAGYDHKGMGITARGAWESVKRHFRELGLDIQSTDFTVVGVGDMSGDVFGNGMLLSRHIRLVAAFDHRHIFLDPHPAADVSFAERERLFKLPRSSWADYDTALISEGGGVWSRAEKSVPLSPQARAALGIDAERLTPTELVSAILKAPVDLLYNGGIGTYVKASTQSHAEVGDRANDALRVDGRELRCKVVGEGGNLGFTQLGRVEAALAGVRLYTDAIDNSAGVDTSDHEVNIKILLGLAQDDGELTDKQRNALLPTLTDEVAALVLRDNYFQTQVLSLTLRQGAPLVEAQARFIHYLEKRGRLNRAIEYLPDDDEIAQRKARGLGLTSPELSVLLAYSKMWLNDELIDSDLPEDPWVAAALARYFPAGLRERFDAYIPRHPLKREIVVTHVLNSMVNRVGLTFVHRQSERTGLPPSKVVRAYLVAREVFGHVALWPRTEALDNRVADAVQAQMLYEMDELTTRATAWLLRSRRLAEPLPAQFAYYGPAVAALEPTLVAEAAGSALAQGWTAAGVPAELAQRIAASDGLFAALDIAELAHASGAPIDDVAQVHAGIAQRLGLPRLRRQIDALPADTHWQNLARGALADDLVALHGAIARDAVAGSTGDADARLAAWGQRHGSAIDRAQRLLGELGESHSADLAMVSVAMRELRNLG